MRFDGDDGDSDSDRLGDAVGEVMGGMRRDVEAAVRVPPYQLVVRRHHRRRRRRAAAGGLVLAAVAAVSVLALPSLIGAPDRAETPTAAVSVRVAPVTGAGTLSLSDVSFTGGSSGTQSGALLGRRCSQTCHDVALSSSDGGGSYGPEVEIAGSHRYVAAGTTMDIAYGPDLAVRRAGDAAWTPLAAPAPVADVSASGGTVLVLLAPTGAPAQLWSGPADADNWSAYTLLGTVPGSDDTARLLRPAPDTVMVVSDGGTARSVVGALAASGTIRWATPADIAVCGPGSAATVSAVTPTTWWVACGSQRTADPARGQEVAVTHDGGHTYTDASPPLGLSTSTTQLVTATAPDIAYLSGGPALLLTEDGGATWRAVLALPGLGTPHVPPGSGGQDVWVVATGATTVYRSTGGGFSGLRLR